MLDVINNGSKGIIGGAILMPLTTITNVATYTCVVVKILVDLVMFYIFSIVSKHSNDIRWYLCEINLDHEIEWMKKYLKRYYNQWIFFGVKSHQTCYISRQKPFNFPYLKITF